MNKVKKILVSGSTGQLGSELNAIKSDYPQFKIDFRNRKNLNLASEQSIKKNLASNYDVFINAGAYTAVDKAESEFSKAKAVNATALKHIAKHAPKKTKIIHISSDYVYHIKSEKLLKETDKTEPKGKYGQTKLAGEQFLLKQRPDAIVLRTSWVYSSFGNNFVKTMLRLGKERDSLNIVADQYGSPTYARDLAKAILELIANYDNPNIQQLNKRGIYNYSNLGMTNWSEFAKEIFKQSKIKCKVGTTTTQAFNAPAPRPLWSMMSKQKFQETFYQDISHWKKSLSRCLGQLNK